MSSIDLLQCKIIFNPYNTDLNLVKLLSCIGYDDVMMEMAILICYGVLRLEIEDLGFLIEI